MTSPHGRRAMPLLGTLAVRRPVLMLVINLLIILGGLASLMGIAIRELPDVDRPIVSVRANYPGASPETMDAEVTRIVEGEIARVSGVTNIESSSEENNMRIRVEFAPQTNLDAAASDVREAVSRAQRNLPDAVEQISVVKADSQAEAVVRFAAFSDTLSRDELAQRLEKDIAPEFLSIPGVADVQLRGNQPRVLRIQIEPARLAASGLGMDEVLEALRSLNFDIPAGSTGAGQQEMLVRAYGTLTDPRRIESMQLRPNLRLGDIATVFYGPDKAESYALLDGRMVVGLQIIRQPGANTLAIAAAATERMNGLNNRLRDLQLVKIGDDAVYIRGALWDVTTTLVLAIIIVLAVIALFLGQGRPTMVPAVTIPVALVGSLASLWLFGFSINLLTLLALVLATGLIVDDAIVVLENIQRHRQLGLKARAAAVAGTQEVVFAVIATTLTLAAVFLPIAFLPGEAGGLFREFALVLAVAVGLSSIVALTLCPVLAARLPETERLPAPLEALRNRLAVAGAVCASFYFRSLDGLLQRPAWGLAVALVIAGLGVLGYQRLNSELLPQEDRGELRIMLTGPDGANLAYADLQARRAEALLQPYIDRGIVESVSTIVGQWDKNRALVIARLVPWSERSMGQIALAEELDTRLREIPGAQVRIMQGNSLNLGRGGGAGGLEVALLGSDYQSIFSAAQGLARTLEAQIPEITDVRVEFDTSQPELAFDIDRDRATDLGVGLGQIADTLRVMIDSYDLLDLSVEDEAVTVMVGAREGVARDPQAILNIYVRSAHGGLVPLSSLVSVREQGVAAELDRRAQRRAINMDIAIPPGAPLGDILARVQEIAAETLPDSISLLPVGEAAALGKTNRELMVLFAVALLVVFLVLAAQFESFGTALVVMFIVPFGLAAAVFALLLTGQTINLYSQIGLVLLIGLMTKNAILLVEFMVQKRDAGLDVHDAVREAVRVRLRPIIMTVLSTVLSALPLILSSGPGAEARQAIGWVIFGGLGLSTLFTLYLTPLGYTLAAPYLKVRAAEARKLEDELAKVSAKGPRP